MAEKKKTGLIAEFKEFISRGSVMDLAVGVIIGGAFSKIVTSLVTDIISPIIGIFTGQANLETLSVTVFSADITYGKFLEAIIDFLLIAFFIFLIIKAINVLRRKQKEEPPAAPPAPSKEEQLLTEIRDLLSKK